MARGLNYTQPDHPDHEDSPLDWLNSAMIFAAALGHLLQETEGVVMDVDGEMKFDGAKKVMVFNSEGMIRVTECNQDLPAGQKLWVH